MNNFVVLESYIHIMLIIGFSIEFKSMSKSDQKKILKSIKDGKFRKSIIQSLGLKFRGRI